MEENVDADSIQQLEDKKNELETLRKDKLRGKLIRSRIQWIEEGEKPTNYFCGLESKNGVIVTNQNETLHEVKLFYENLYKNRDDENICTLQDIEDGLGGINFRKLTEEEQESLEGEITYKEASETLKNMKNNKTPGSDGFSVEFF